ncbi:MAG: GYD domain-containing protein [Myxococcota bacterium]
MPSYIVLIRYTDQGMQNIKDGPARLERARQDYEAAGAKLKDFYLTMGSYDAVAVIEAPDDETMARLSLAVGSRGTSRSETLRAFSEDEFRRIVGAL